jgi:hypothetical protein
MRYYDYIWELNPDQLLLDQELNIDKLGWKHGDIFRLVNVNGRAALRKIDPLERFTRGYNDE